MITHEVKFEAQPLELAVPQVSVLAPILFTLYSAPVGIIARMHDLSVHLYADDSEVYLAFGSAEAEVSVIRVERCVNDIKTWTTFHKLKMNNDKTEILEIQSIWDTSRSGITHISVGEESIPLSDASTSLGALLVRHFNVHVHVRRVCRSAYFQLKQIADFRSSLSQRTAGTLVHSFIMSKLDYGNALSYTVCLTGPSPFSGVSRTRQRVW